MAAKFDGADAYSYMGFCCDSYVTPVVAAIYSGFHGVIEGRGGLKLSMDFVGMATIGLTATMDGGDDFQSILTINISSIFKKKCFIYFQQNIFKVFSLG